MNVTASRWQLALDIRRRLDEGDIWGDDADFLTWLMEYKNCPLGPHSGEFNAVKLNDRQVRTLLAHYSVYRNPARFAKY